MVGLKSPRRVDSEVYGECVNRGDRKEQTADLLERRKMPRDRLAKETRRHRRVRGTLVIVVVVPSA